MIFAFSLLLNHGVVYAHVSGRPREPDRVGSHQQGRTVSGIRPLLATQREASGAGSHRPLRPRMARTRARKSRMSVKRAAVRLGLGGGLRGGAHSCAITPPPSWRVISLWPSRRRSHDHGAGGNHFENAGASAPSECVLRTADWHHSARMRGLGDSIERRSPPAHPPGVGGALPSRTSAREPRAGHSRRHCCRSGVATASDS
jgi:hypothetical protein